ncbi:hypothetical protein CC86DRAFT_372879 [Ophiobolus disseminans]|uniref:Uncharacterized protein n=1 Tax=Ophiobolus disseminans TaxID=1469910 RepID=A0A6A6ZPI1_9PLEO|nr:hypothetical protein CC86DRAFT_372879 [Ophiobolus disseminans]
MAKLYIKPIEYNSECITFPEWISLFTLCLAPLIAHILSGTPPVSHLSNHRPRWYDHLCHYNPTSIIWRYAAITDRRIRALNWSRNDLAASNAIFWTAKGWDGGEQMVAAAASHCTRLPEHTRVKIRSTTTLKTVITALQGASAAYSLIGLLAGNTNLTFVALMGLDMVFFPLAVLGLLRLCAAAWLAEDFEFLPRDATIPARPNTMASGDVGSQSDLHPFLITMPGEGMRFKPPGSSWASWLFRVFYFFIVAGACAMSIVYSVPYGPVDLIASTTSFVVGLFYIFFFSISAALYAFYFLRSQTTTTLLPCLSRTWYKMYTFLLFSSMLVIIIIASIETNKGPDGRYISVRPPVRLSCASQNRWWALGSDNTLSGVMSAKNSTIGQDYAGAEVTHVSSNSSMEKAKYWLYDFTGYCVGQLSNSTTP